jgi:hypothetical protein
MLLGTFPGPLMLLLLLPARCELPLPTFRVAAAATAPLLRLP